MARANPVCILQFPIIINHFFGHQSVSQVRRGGLFHVGAGDPGEWSRSLVAARRRSAVRQAGRQHLLLRLLGSPDDLGFAHQVMHGLFVRTEQAHQESNVESQNRGKC